MSDTARQRAHQLLGRSDWRDVSPDLARPVARDLLAALDRVDKLEAELRDAWAADLYTEDGVKVWIADAEAKGQSVSEQLVRLEQLRTGAFS